MKTTKTARQTTAKRMSRIVLLLIAALWILIAMSSCTVEKPLYRAGLSIDFNKSHVKSSVKSVKTETVNTGMNELIVVTKTEEQKLQVKEINKPAAKNPIKVSP